MLTVGLSRGRPQQDGLHHYFSQRHFCCKISAKTKESVSKYIQDDFLRPHIESLFIQLCYLRCKAGCSSGLPGTNGEPNGFLSLILGGTGVGPTPLSTVLVLDTEGSSSTGSKADLADTGRHRFGESEILKPL